MCSDNSVSGNHHPSGPPALSRRADSSQAVGMASKAMSPGAESLAPWVPTTSSKYDLKALPHQALP